MEFIILAGGFGTRLRYVVSDVPKPMAPVGGRPFLEHLIDYLLPFDPTQVVLSTGYMHEKIEQHFGHRYRGIPIAYAYEDHPLGTGGGMLNALSRCHGDEVVVLNGDTMFRIDYHRLQRFHHQHDAMLSVVLRQVEDTARYGSVTLDDSSRIQRFTEKSAATGAGLINGGIYMLRRSLFDGFRLGDTFSFEKELMERQVERLPFYGYAADDYFIDIGVPEDYYRFCDEATQADNQ